MPDVSLSTDPSRSRRYDDDASASVSVSTSATGATTQTSSSEPNVCRQPDLPPGPQMSLDPRAFSNAALVCPEPKSPPPPPPATMPQKNSCTTADDQAVDKHPRLPPREQDSREIVQGHAMKPGESLADHEEAMRQQIQTQRYVADSPLSAIGVAVAVLNGASPAEAYQVAETGAAEWGIAASGAGIANPTPITIRHEPITTPKP